LVADLGHAVTGGARGLGLTIANAIIEAGGDVYCCDILQEPSQDEWQALQVKAKRYGSKAEYKRLDITDVKGVTECFNSIAAESRYPIVGFLAGAATMHEQTAIDCDMEAFSRLMRVNIDGTMITAQAAARIMRENGQGGSIVIIASISGHIANRV
jgi:NAD(P)-dependent dehydrogenase (short-subunit alcohol dehydrogenase family)